jgi:hypothetical protein
MIDWLPSSAIPNEKTGSVSLPPTLKIQGRNAFIIEQKNMKNLADPPDRSGCNAMRRSDYGVPVPGPQIISVCSCFNPISGAPPAPGAGHGESRSGEDAFRVAGTRLLRPDMISRPSLKPISRNGASRRSAGVGEEDSRRRTSAISLQTAGPCAPHMVRTSRWAIPDGEGR